jgi:hypothetical protein
MKDIDCHRNADSSGHGTGSVHPARTWTIQQIAMVAATIIVDMPGLRSTVPRKFNQ